MNCSKYILWNLFLCCITILIVGNTNANSVAIVHSNQTLKIDSATIKVISPTKAKEINLFADKKLHYIQTPGVTKNILEQFIDWLAQKLFNNTGYSSLINAQRIIIWTVAISVIGLLIWLLSKSELVSLIKPKAKATSFNFIDVMDDLDKINFDEKIKAAVMLLDYRLATRWNYLKILFLLDKNQLISFAAHKTNIDYKYELKDKKQQPIFTQLSYIYEFVWYGKFEINAADYFKNEVEFINFEKELSV